MPGQESTDEEKVVELFNAWFVKPMCAMDIDGGFVAFMVALALYERLITAKLKVENLETGEAAIRRKMSEDLGLTDDERRIFWDLFRNGLLHQGMPRMGRTGFIFHPNFTEQPKLRYSSEKAVFCIDPWKFYKRVVKEFLDDPRLITASDSFPFASVGEVNLDELSESPPEA